MSIVHEVLNRFLPLRRAHTAIEHDSVEARTAETPLYKLQHGSELREDDGLVGLLLTPQLVQIVDKHLDLGGRSPILHFDSVDD